MKKILPFLFTIISITAFSQNIKVIGPDTTTGRPGYLFTLKPQYLQSPLYAVDDSTAGSHAIDSLKYSGDSVYGYKDGAFIYQYSITGGGGTASAAGASGNIQFRRADGAYFSAKSTLTFDSTNGYLGIGTATPSYDIHVKRTINGNARMLVENPSSGSTASAVISVLNDANASGSLSITSSGYSNPPAAVLPNSMQFLGAGVRSLLIRVLNTAGDVTTKPPIVFLVGDSGQNEAMRIFHSKNISINSATDSSSALAVNGTTKTVTLAVTGNATVGGTATITGAAKIATSLLVGSTGTQASGNELQVIDEGSSGNRGFILGQHNTGAQAPLFTTQKSRGTFASPSVVTSGDYIGLFDWKGYVGATNTYYQGARIAALVNGTVTDNTAGLPTNLIFYVNKGDGSTGLTERLRLDKNGNISTTGADGTANLHLKAGTATASTAPLKFTIGTVLTTPEAGAVEFDGTNYWVTTTGGGRILLTRTITGTAAPATTPAAVGMQFVDTTNKKLYVATGTASSADWTILN